MIPSFRFFSRLVCILQFLLVLTIGASAQPRHPLDPLSKEEIATAVTVLRAAPGFPAEALFSTVVLHEPPKDEVISYTSGNFRREAFAVVMDRPNNRTFEAVVDLRTKKLVSWNEINGAQPLVFVAEYDVLPGIVKADPRWQAAMKRRGITNFDSVLIDGWAAGEVSGGQGGRLLRGLSYYKGNSINFYGRPIEGVVALVDMNARKVVEVTDADPLPIPPRGPELDTASMGKLRTAPKPLIISQPKGTSFTVNGNEVRWQGWRFRYSMHPREGLVLHTVAYEDNGKVRSVMYRGSLSEMVVPYCDPDSNWRWRSAFDVGEYGVGRLASTLEPNTDVPPNAKLFDAAFVNDSGVPYTLPHCVGIYERDGGILWKHFESYSGTNESRRARDLVIFFIAVIGNYDYSVSWIFHQDGTMEVDAGLSGIMLPKGVAQSVVGDHNEVGSFGHLVAPNVVAPHHQHFFCFRMDMDIDGTGNAVSEINTMPSTDPTRNPTGNAFEMTETVFGAEKVAGRRISVDSARLWSVFNPLARNALGQHTGYILVPGPNSIPLSALTSSVRKRSGFTMNHFWATRYHPDEMYAAGAYPNQSKGGDGIPQWVADDEGLVNRDVVLWYTMGITHVPRPEEWPVMPMVHVGFKLIPAGFFVRNPALDVPR